MANERSAKNNAANTAILGIDFDVLGWIKGVMDTVDQSRSDTPGNQNIVVESSLDTTSGRQAESRLNCFYRLLGFPATRDSTNTSEAGSRALNQNGTINYFHPNELFDDNVPGQFHSREATLQIPRTTENLIDMLKQPLQVSQLTDSPDPKRRINIFPMVADASVPVYPIAKRVAPLFYPGDYLLPGNKQNRLPRSFLETVIYIRTQQFSAETEKDSVVKLQALKDFLKTASDSVSQTDEQSATLLANFINQNNIANNNFTKLETDIINKLIIAVRNASFNYNGVVVRTNRLSREVDFRPAPISNARGKSGSSDLLTVDSVSTEPASQIDRRIAQLNLDLNKATSLINTLPTTRIQEADTTYRITNSLNVNNVSPDLFVSEFTDLISYEKKSIQSQLDEATQLRAQKIQEFEVLRQSLMTYTGEGLGLAIFDVLCIFLALFTIDLENLIKLLNADAIQRLRDSKFFSFQNGGNQGADNTVIFGANSRANQIEQAINNPLLSTSQALKNLEEVVRNNFKLAQAFYIEASHSGG